MRRANLVLLLPLALVLLEGAPHKCGFSQRHVDKFSHGTISSLQRPVRQKMFISSTGNFAIHYDTTGAHAPNLTSNRPDGSPDWVVEVAIALDSARALLLDMGYTAAPPDDDGIYDVYLKDYDGYIYGETWPEIALSGSRYSSYLEMDNDFSSDELYYTFGLDAARVTAAHEYFHAVQMGYSYPGQVFFYELSSTWFEDVAYPEVNDWANWVDSFHGNPEQNLANTDGYSVALFGHYLTSQVNPNAMRTAWEAFKTEGAIDALQTSLSRYGTHMVSAWVDFIARMLANGREPSLYFYADQALVSPLETGAPVPLTDSVSVAFDFLAMGTARIARFFLPDPANVKASLLSSQNQHLVRLFIDSDSLGLMTLQDDRYLADLRSFSEITAVGGGVSGYMEITLVPIDTLRGLQFALDMLFPNPIRPGSQNQVSMQLDYTVGAFLEPGNHHIVIYNLLGREVLKIRQQKNVGEGSKALVIPAGTLQPLASGIYILTLQIDNRFIGARKFTLIK